MTPIKPIDIHSEPILPSFKIKAAEERLWRKRVKIILGFVLKTFENN
jgi:hypothetical protein